MPPPPPLSGEQCKITSCCLAVLRPPWRLLLPACSKTFYCMISSPQTVLTKTTRKNHHIQNRYIAGWQRYNASFEFRKQEPVNVHEKNIRMNCVSNTVLMNGRNLCKHCSYPLCHLSVVYNLIISISHFSLNEVKSTALNFHKRFWIFLPPNV